MSEKQYTFKEIKEICIQKRLEGLKVREVQKYILNEFDVDWSYNRIKNATRLSRNPELKAARGLHGSTRARRASDVKQGKTERKPKYKKTETGYMVFYGKNKKVLISDEELDKAFKLYCVAKLTLNQVALELGITREEFYAVKTAFSITKDSVPFAPERIDELSSDELAEEIRITKKRFALQKLHANKYADIESEIKKFNKKSYWFNLAMERLSKIEPKPFEIEVKRKRSNQKHLCLIADCHSGMKSDNLMNKYNFEIMRNRFKELASRLIQELEPCELIIADLGDKLSGILHGSLIQSSENCIDSIFELVDCYTGLFLTLIKNGFFINFASVSGNHDAIFPNKTDRTDESSFSRIVDWALKIQFQSFVQIKFLESIDNMALIPLFDYHVLCLHGDKSKNLARYERLFRDKNVKEIISAHCHSYSANENENIPVYRVNSFCGSDAYSIGLGLSSEAGVRLVSYTEKGRFCDKLIRL